MQLTRPDPRQKQGTPPTTPLTQVHPQPAAAATAIAAGWKIPNATHEPSQLSFFGSRDSQPTTSNKPWSHGMFQLGIQRIYIINHFDLPIDSHYVFTSRSSSCMHECTALYFAELFNCSLPVNAHVLLFLQRPLNPPDACTHFPHHSPRLVQAISTVPPACHCFPTDPD